MINEKMSGSHMDTHFLQGSLQATSLYKVNRNEETGEVKACQSQKEAHATLTLFPLLVLTCWPHNAEKMRAISKLVCCLVAQVQYLG